MFPIGVSHRKQTKKVKRNRNFFSGEKPMIPQEEAQVRNYLAIRYLEKIGFLKPTQNQIDMFEQYLIDSGCNVFAQYQKQACLAVAA
jgi:hypothetical protein